MPSLRAASKYLFWGAGKLIGSPPGPRLLIYHQVGAGTGRQMDITRDDFAFQVGWLEENYEVVALDVALDRWEEEDSDRLVVLTFDDGYRDTFTTAFPMLEDRGWPFTLYIATQMIEEGPERDMGSPPLSWDQVRQMVDSGLVTVGAHTHTHRDLREVPVDVVEEELEVSDRLLAERIGTPPEHFAYPWGYWSEMADGVVRSRYRSAVLGGSPSTERPFDSHRIHRYPVQLSDGRRFFPARLRGGLLLEERVRRWLRGYRGP